MTKHLGNVNQVGGDVSGSNILLTDEASGVSSAKLTAGTTVAAAGFAKFGIGTTSPSSTLDVRGHHSGVPVATVRAPVKTYTITNRARTSNVSTLTIGAHGFIVSEQINVTGVADATFNVGSNSILGVTATTVSYTNAGSDVASTASAGTATVVQSSTLQVWVNAANSTVASVGNTGIITGIGSGLTALDAGNVSAGTLPLTRGGTGQTSASTAINALVPTQSGNSGKVLGTNATAVSWVDTVSSVTGSGGTTGLTLSGGPITTTGTLTLGGTLALANGGTGQTSASTAINALVPTQTGNSGKYLTTNATSVSWGTLSGSGASLTNLDASQISSGLLASNYGGLPGSYMFAGGRLTLDSNTSVAVANQTAKTTLYYVPHTSNVISLYDTSISAYRPFTFGTPSLALGTLTNNTNYDVFARNASGSFSMSLVGWTNDSTRATAISFDNTTGAWTKTSDTTYRYLGTIRTTSTTTTEDSATKRYVFNAYNQVRRTLRKQDSTSSWSGDGLSAYRYFRGDSNNKVEFVHGHTQQPIDMSLMTRVYCAAAANNYTFIGIGIDTATSPTVLTTAYGLNGNYDASPTPSYTDYLSVGYHYASAMEFTVITTPTIHGSAVAGSGLTGAVWA